MQHCWGPDILLNNNASPRKEIIINTCMSKSYSTEKVNLAACLGIAFFGVAMLSLGAILPPLTKAVPQAIGLPMYMSVGIIAGTVLFGPIMDRYGYKWLLIASCLVMLCGLLILAYSTDMPLLTVGIFCVGFGGGVLNGETNAIVSDIYDEDRRGRKMSILGACYCIGAMVWTLACIVVPNYKISLIACAVIMLLSVIFFISIRFPKAKVTAATKPSGKEYRGMLTSAALLMVGFTLFFQSGFEGVSGSYTTSFLTKFGGIAEGDAVLSLTFFTVGMMIGRFALGAMMKKGRDIVVLFIYMLIALAGVVLLGWWTSYRVVAWIAMALIGFGVGATFPVMLARLGGVFRRMSGSAFSAAIFIALCGQFLGNFLVGRLFGSGEGFAFVYVLGGMIVAILILAPFASLACKKHGTNN